jgi:hypothetical protein
MEQLQNIIAIITSPALQENIVVASMRWFFIMSAAFLLLFTVYIKRTSPMWKELDFTNDLKDFFDYKPRAIRKTGKRWRRIMARMETGSEAEFKQAIIEADTILAETLERMNLPGDTTDQRLLQVTKTMITKVAELQQVHQVRNQIVHNPDYRISENEVKDVLEVYEAVFKELDLMGQ